MNKLKNIVSSIQHGLVTNTIILLLLSSPILYSCSSQNKIIGDQGNDSLYRIKKVKSVNDWNIIYATKGDSTFKIISKKSKPITAQCIRVKKGRYYNLKLYSRKNNPPEINGVKVSPMNYLSIECYGYDEKTKICIEPKKGINDLHSSPNIVGLCYVKSE